MVIFINIESYKYLWCPKCRSSLKLIIINESKFGIKTGKLNCEKCSKSYSIINYIPRFVKNENYTSNFGFEWNTIGHIRSDRYNKTNSIRNTILYRTGWNPDNTKGKLILECGCGAGNDTEVLLDLGMKVIAFDYSNSVDMALLNNKLNRDLLIIQADIYNIPLKEEVFDIVYCHRVIQHTPNPETTFYSIIKHLKKSGEVFLHSYSLTPMNLLHYHYILRPFTKRINYSIVFKILKIIGPILYWLVGKIQEIKRFKVLKNILLRVIPFDNLDYTLTDSRLKKKKNIILVCCMFLIV